jgi:lysophospholipase L1-like esterase
MRALRMLLFVVLIMPFGAAVPAAYAGQDAGPVYYLSVGDSLSVGVQPDSEGETNPTNEGYADQLYAMLKEQTPNLELVKLGCKSETTNQMINGGGRCTYVLGTQLAQVLDFITTHQGQIAYITVSLGANDAAACVKDGALDGACAAETFTTAPANLAFILAAIRQAAGPDVPMAGLNLYNIYASAWFDGPEGEQVARRVAGMTVLFNQVLVDTYRAAGAGIADLETAFAVADFDTLVEQADGTTLPLAVARLCQWTWQCTPPPTGPDKHPNPAGYAVTARLFYEALTTPVVYRG